MDLRKSEKKLQSLVEDLEEKVAETATNGHEMEDKLQEAQAIAKEDALMHQMMLREH